MPPATPVPNPRLIGSPEPLFGKHDGTLPPESAALIMAYALEQGGARVSVRARTAGDSSTLTVAGFFTPEAVTAALGPYGAGFAARFSKIEFVDPLKAGREFLGILKRKAPSSGASVVAETYFCHDAPSCSLGVRFWVTGIMSPAQLREAVDEAKGKWQVVEAIHKPPFIGPDLTKALRISDGAIVSNWGTPATRQPKIGAAKDRPSIFSTLVSQMDRCPDLRDLALSLYEGAVKALKPVAIEVTGKYYAPLDSITVVSDAALAAAFARMQSISTNELRALCGTVARILTSDDVNSNVESIKTGLHLGDSEDDFLDEALGGMIREVFLRDIRGAIGNEIDGATLVEPEEYEPLAGTERRWDPASETLTLSRAPDHDTSIQFRGADTQYPTVTYAEHLPYALAIIGRFLHAAKN